MNGVIRMGDTGEFHFTTNHNRSPCSLHERPRVGAPKKLEYFKLAQYI
jgi:hypothetical protein